MTYVIVFSKFIAQLLERDAEIADDTKLFIIEKRNVPTLLYQQAWLRNLNE